MICVTAGSATRVLNANANPPGVHARTARYNDSDRSISAKKVTRAYGKNVIRKQRKEAKIDSRQPLYIRTWTSKHGEVENRCNTRAMHNKHESVCPEAD